MCRILFYVQCKNFCLGKTTYERLSKKNQQKLSKTEEVTEKQTLLSTGQNINLTNSNLEQARLTETTQ